MNRRIDVMDHMGVVARAFNICNLLRRFRLALAMVELRCNSEVAGLGHPPRHRLGKIADAILVLYHDDGWKWTRAIGLAQVKPHRTVIYRNGFPGIFHR